MVQPSDTAEGCVGDETGRGSSPPTGSRGVERLENALAEGCNLCISTVSGAILRRGSIASPAAAATDAECRR